MNTVLKRTLEEYFIQALYDLKDIKETDTYVKDFFTPSELETFSKRLAIGYYLRKKRSYSNIKNNLGVSSATIAQVEKDMKKKGFDLALRKLEAEEWANLWSQKIKGFIKK